MRPKKVEEVKGQVVFQKVLETARGGFTLDVTELTVGEILPAGTPMTYDGTTRKAKKANTDGSDVKGLLYTDVKISTDSTVSIVTRGTVYEKRLNSAEITSKVKKALPLIIFDDSF